MNITLPIPILEQLVDATTIDAKLSILELHGKDASEIALLRCLILNPISSLTPEQKDLLESSYKYLSTYNKEVANVMMRRKLLPLLKRDSSGEIPKDTLKEFLELCKRSALGSSISITQSATITTDSKREDETDSVRRASSEFDCSRINPGQIARTASVSSAYRKVKSSQALEMVIQKVLEEKDYLVALNLLSQKITSHTTPGTMELFDLVLNNYDIDDSNYKQIKSLSTFSPEVLDSLAQKHPKLAKNLFFFEYILSKFVPANYYVHPSPCFVALNSYMGSLQFLRSHYSNAPAQVYHSILTGTILALRDVYIIRSEAMKDAHMIPLYVPKLAESKEFHWYGFDEMDLSELRSKILELFKEYLSLPISRQYLLRSHTKNEDSTLYLDPLDSPIIPFPTLWTTFNRPSRAKGSGDRSVSDIIGYSALSVEKWCTLLLIDAYCAKTEQITTDNVEEIVGNVKDYLIDVEHVNVRRYFNAWYSMTRPPTSAGANAISSFLSHLPSNLAADLSQEYKDVKLLHLIPNSHTIKRPKQPLTISMRIKGITELSIKAFHIRSATYCQENLHEVPLSISLDGLPAKFSEKYVFPNVSPFSLHTLSYTLPETDKERSERALYVVEVSGGGYRSRVRLQRGWLSAAISTNRDGYHVCVVDEDGIAIDSACIICDKQTFGCVGCVEPSLPRFIPFVTESSMLSAVIKDSVSSEFGEFVTLDVPKETYSLWCHATVPRESIGGSGEKVPIVLLGHVVLNGGDAIPLADVADLSIRCTITDFQGDESTACSIKNDEARKVLDGQQTLNLKLPTTISKISFAVTGEVSYSSFSSNQGKRQHLSWTDCFCMNDVLRSGANRTVRFERGPEGKELYLRVVDVSGEPCPELPVIVSCSSSHFSHHDLTSILETDDSGRIDISQSIGVTNQLSFELELVPGTKYRFSVDVADLHMDGQFHSSSPTNRDIVSIGSITSIPMPPSCASIPLKEETPALPHPRVTAFYRHGDSPLPFQVQDVPVEIIGGVPHAIFEALHEGSVTIRAGEIDLGRLMIATERSCEEGEIEKRYLASMGRQLTELTYQPPIAPHIMAEITDKKENGDLLVDVTLESEYLSPFILSSGNVKCLCAFSSFAPFYDRSREIIQVNPIHDCAIINLPIKLPLEQDILDIPEEVAYVHKRALIESKDKQMTVSMSKPGLVMRPFNEGEAKATYIGAKEGQAFDSFSSSAMPTSGARLRGKRSFKTKDIMCAKQDIMFEMADEYECEEEEYYFADADEPAPCGSGSIDSVMSFRYIEPKTHCCVVTFDPESCRNGSVTSTITIPAHVLAHDACGFCSIVCFAGNKTIRRVVPLSLKSEPKVLRDVSLKYAYPPDSELVQHRSIALLDKDNSCELTDILSARIFCAQSVKDMWDLATRTCSDQDHKLLKFAEFAGFCDMDETQQLKLYRRYPCHEVNLFISMHCPEFAQKYIIPILRTKLDKDIVDMWLCSRAPLFLIPCGEGTSDDEREELESKVQNAMKSSLQGSAAWFAPYLSPLVFNRLPFFERFLIADWSHAFLSHLGPAMAAKELGSRYRICAGYATQTMATLMPNLVINQKHKMFLKREEIARRVADLYDTVLKGAEFELHPPSPPPAEESGRYHSSDECSDYSSSDSSDDESGFGGLPGNVGAMRGMPISEKECQRSIVSVEDEEECMMEMEMCVERPKKKASLMSRKRAMRAKPMSMKSISTIGVDFSPSSSRSSSRAVPEKHYKSLGVTKMYSEVRWFESGSMAASFQKRPFECTPFWFDLINRSFTSKGTWIYYQHPSEDILSLFIDSRWYVHMLGLAFCGFHCGSGDIIQERLERGVRFHSGRHSGLLVKEEIMNSKGTEEREEESEEKPKDLDNDLIIQQRIVDPLRKVDGRCVSVNSNKLRPGQIYQCELNIVNPSTSEMDVDILYQIPHRAVTVAADLPTKCEFRIVDPLRKVDGRCVSVNSNKLRPGQIYQCELNIVNPSTSEMDVDILYQIPHRAVTVAADLPTKCEFVTIVSGPYSVGRYTHVPAQISSNGVFVGKASGATILKVKKERSITDRVKDSGVLLLQDLLKTPLKTALKLLKGRNIKKMEKESSMSLDDLFIHHLGRNPSPSNVDVILAFLHSCGHFCPKTLTFALNNEAKYTLIPVLLDPQTALNLFGCAFVCEEHGVILEPNSTQTSLHHSDFKPIVGSRAHILRKGFNRINIPRLAEFYKSILVNVLHLNSDNLPQALQLSRTYCMIAYERYKEAYAYLQTLGWAHDRFEEWKEMSSKYDDLSEISLGDLSLPASNASVFNVQFDAMVGFLDLCTSENVPKISQCVASCYRTMMTEKDRTGVLVEDSWFSFFSEMYSHSLDKEDLDEMEDNGDDAIVDGDAARDVQRNKAMRMAAEKEERVTFSVKKTPLGNMVCIAANNVEVVKLRVFPVSIETLFSLKPFECVSSVSSLPVQFLSSPYPYLNIRRKQVHDSRHVDGFVFSDISEEQNSEVPFIEEDEAYFEREVYLPESMRYQSVIVEVSSPNSSPQVKIVSSSGLICTTKERYGQVSVHQMNGKCVECCYVKCFSKMIDGQVKFYKDGYTDRRGVFDYATVSAIPLESVSEFSLLVVHKDFGSSIVSAKPPKPE
ncbi:hypothetical protein ADUPG1_006807 [Aduncisulcus paluster]|uniref:Uncharacterized protein n=1 Tax=Aduncisulcus paluster TaxID=2918883 RepID=A0ABQ5KJP2_9EUKA|nr:hypothetical protein ADUPG1_006807 [Aduncisulcus paluster]